MQIIVLGGGAIGSLYGAKLSGQNDVILVARPAHVDAINADGLRIEGLDPRTVRIDAATTVEKIEQDALILLTTKVPDTKEALEPVGKLLRDDTTIVSLQNGLGSEQLAKAVLDGRGVVLRGITQFGAIFERPGVIKFMVRGHTEIEKHERSSRIADILNAAGLDCRISPNITSDVWRKLIFNCVVNPITSIIGSEVGRITDPGLGPLKQLVIDECLAVAAAEGIVFDLDFMHEIDSFYSGSPNTVSMRQDLLRGRQTEIDYLNGAVVSLGAKHGIDCPVNRGLTEIIKAMSSR
jgi:2-dehydropantoate 2-reductase